MRRTYRIEIVSLLAALVLAASCGDETPFEDVTIQTAADGTDRVLKADGATGCALTTSLENYTEFCDSGAAPERTLQFCFGNAIAQLPEVRDVVDLADELVASGLISARGDFLRDDDGGSFDPDPTMPHDVLVVLTNDPDVQLNTGLGAGFDCFVADRVIVETGAPDGSCAFADIPDPSGDCP